MAYQFLNCHHSDAVLLCKAFQLRQPGHSAVIIHDLDNDTCWLESRQTGQVDAGLSESCALQYSSFLGLKWKEMTGSYNIGAPRLGGD